nr:V-type ATP synthase subunit E [uncultured Blautia sp.]
MTIEEKLTHFYDTSVEVARQEAAKIIEEHRKALDEALAEHKKAALQDAENSRKAEIENARREVNKALSAEQLTIKRNWTTKQNNLKEKLFAEVKEHISSFMASPEYEDYLCHKIQAAIDFADKDEIQIYLSSTDEAHLKPLIQKTGFPVQLSEETFMGGIKAMIPHKNILIDNSFDQGFQAAYKEFKFDGGPAHE